MVLQPREKNEAFCNRNDNDSHFPPEEKCTCGFYSFKTYEKLVSEGYGCQDFTAEVYYWGKIIECTEGYRAQYCYPKTIYGTSNQKYAEYIADLYGVPYGGVLGPKTSSETAKHQYVKPLTFEDYWDVAFNPKNDVSLRKFARQQIRQRVYMKMRSRDQREIALRKELNRIIRLKTDLNVKWEAIERLKEDLK